MRVTPIVRTALLLIVAGCSEPWPRPARIPPDELARDLQAYRDYRRSRLIAPGAGPVTWVGLWELRDGSARIGADPSLPIALPAKLAPRLVGTIERAGAEIRFSPASRTAVRRATGAPVRAPIPLKSDRTDSATTLAIGTLRLRVHGEPGTDRLWLRAWDEAHPARAAFVLPDAYPADTAWRVSARFDRYAEARSYEVPDITNGTQAYRSPGELVFRAGGREHRLIAFQEPKDTMFFIMLWDSTARTTTYPSGRYMRAPLPDSAGWTVMDFNRAYNPPCVFTEFSTCAFAPRENRLALSITAGEKRAP